MSYMQNVPFSTLSTNSLAFLFLSSFFASLDEEAEPDPVC